MTDLIHAPDIDPQGLQRAGIGLSPQHSVSAFAQRILVRAEQLGMNKLQLARKAALSRQTLETTLQSAGRGHNSMPSLNTFLLLAHALRVHPAWLMEGLFCNVVVPMRIDVTMNATRSPNVTDLNFPDGALVAPGSSFTKSWRIHNPSQQVWRGVTLACLDHQVVLASKRTGDALFTADHLHAESPHMALPELLPGASCEVHMGFTAPATNGTVVTRWEARGPDGLPLPGCPFGVWAMVHVTTLSDTLAFEPLPMTPASRQAVVDGRAVVSEAVLHGTEISRRVVRRMAELGRGKADVMARAALSRQTLDNLLRPAPAAHPHRRHMPSVRTLLCLASALKVHPYWLIEGLLADARVSLHLQALMQGDRAGYVEDPNVPDHCLVKPGERFRKTFAAQNLSGVAWRGRKVVCWDAHIDLAAHDMAGHSQPVARLLPDVPERSIGDVLPDQVITDSLDFTAPMTEGPAVSYWRVFNADGSPCYAETAGLWVVVWVSADARAHEMFPSALPTRTAQ